MQSTVMRAFVAVELPPAVTQELANAQRRLGRGAVDVARWVAPKGIHLTLKFLGDVEARRTAEIADAVATACRSAQSLELNLNGAGCFPRPERPRVIWIGLGGDVSGLQRLQRLVDVALVGIGFPAEARGFTPHLTLARIRDGGDAAQVRGLMERLQGLVVEPVTFFAEEVALIRSELRPEGAVYETLSTVRLGEAGWGLSAHPVESAKGGSY